MTITVKLDPELEGRLRLQLAASGLTISDYVRAALAEKLEREQTKATPYELWQKYFEQAATASEPDLPHDASARVGELVRKKLRAKHRSG